MANQPNDAPLEATQNSLQDFGRYLTTVREVDSVVTFAGLSAPIDFNGLVRHYYLMQGPFVGQLRVNLAEKERRQRGQPCHRPVGAARHGGNRPEAPDPNGHRGGAAGAAGPANPGGGGLWATGRRLSRAYPAGGQG